MRRFILPALLLVILAAPLTYLGRDPARALGLDTEVRRLYDADTSRGKVIKADYAYYPERGELRVRLILAGGREAHGTYSDPAVTRTMMQILQGDIRRLFCTFQGNQLLAVYRE